MKCTYMNDVMIKLDDQVIPRKYLKSVAQREREMGRLVRMLPLKLR